MKQTVIISFIFGALIIVGLIFLYLQGVFNNEKPTTKEHFANNPKMALVEYTPEQIYRNEKINAGLIKSDFDLTYSPPGKPQEKVVSESIPTKSTTPTSIDDSCKAFKERRGDMLLPDPVTCVGIELDDIYRSQQARFASSPSSKEADDNAVSDSAISDAVPEYCGTLGYPSSDNTLRYYTAEECTELGGNNYNASQCFFNGLSYSSACRGLNSLPTPYQGGSASDSTGSIDSPAPYDKRDSDVASAELGDSSSPAAALGDSSAPAAALSDSYASAERPSDASAVATALSDSSAAPFDSSASAAISSDSPAPYERESPVASAESIDSPPSPSIINDVVTM